AVPRLGHEIMPEHRQEKPMNRYFPELVEPLAAGLPERSVVDGEIVIVSDAGAGFGRLLLPHHPSAPPPPGPPERSVVDGEIVIVSDAGLDFEALLLRIHPAASRVKLLAAESPASFVAWDLRPLGGEGRGRL